MKKAFSMIEMIFAIAVIGILSAIAIPKMMANKQTAQIVKLKEQVEAIRKGIEAYAGNQYLETGRKTYPIGLCTNASGNTSGCQNNMNQKRFFTAVLPKSADFGSKQAQWNGWTNGVTHETFIFYADNKKNGYIFEYDETTGEFKCLNSYSKTKPLPCKDLGE